MKRRSRANSAHFRRCLSYLNSGEIVLHAESPGDLSFCRTGKVGDGWRRCFPWCSNYLKFASYNRVVLSEKSRELKSVYLRKHNQTGLLNISFLERVALPSTANKDSDVIQLLRFANIKITVVIRYFVGAVAAAKTALLQRCAPAICLRRRRESLCLFCLAHIFIKGNHGVFAV